MATRAETVEAIVDALSGAGEVTAKKMFGEYGLYLGGRMVALACDDQLFVKPTAEGRALEPDLGEAPPYPGAKPHLAVPGDLWDERDRLAALLRATAAALPEPKPHKGRVSPRARS